MANSILHPEEVPLLRAIYQDPRDDARRLVYADWHEEYGDPHRATLVRYAIKAAKILGRRNVLGILEVERNLDVRFTEAKTKYLANAMFSMDELKAARRTHMLAAGFPLNIEMMQPKCGKLLRLDDIDEFLGGEDLEEEDQTNIDLPATQQRVADRWYLFPKKSSCRHPGISEREAKDCEIVYMWLNYYLMNKRRLLTFCGQGSVNYLDFRTGQIRIFFSDGDQADLECVGSFNCRLGKAPA